MLENEAIVLSCDAGFALVRPAVHSPCGQCDPVLGCRSLSIARMFSLRTPSYRVRNDIGAQAGDKVIVAMHERAMLVSAALLYGLPVLGLLAGAIVGRAGGEWFSVGLAIALFALTLYVVHRHAARLALSLFFVPAIVRRIDSTQVIFESRKTCRSKK